MHEPQDAGSWCGITKPLSKRELVVCRCTTEKELSVTRRDFTKQKAEFSKLSDEWEASRASAESMTMELAAARKQLSVVKAEAGQAANDRISLMKENSHLRQQYTQAMVTTHWFAHFHPRHCRKWLFPPSYSVHRFPKPH